MQKRFGTFEKWSPGRGYCGVHGLGKDTLYLTITILYLFHFLPLWTIPFWHWNMPDKTIWKRILDHCKTKETCPQISQSRKMFFSIKVMRFFVLCSTVEVLWCFGSVWLEELIMVQEQWQIWTLPWVLLQKPNCKMQCVEQKGRHLPRREYGNYFLRCRVKRWPVKAACKVYTPTEHRNDIIRCLNSDKVKTRV